MTDTIRIFIADDHPVFRNGLHLLLDAEPGLHVVGEGGNGRETLAGIAALSPDVLLLDFVLPDMSGIEVLRSLSAAGSSVRTVFVTAGMDTPQVLEALQVGARGLVLKTSATALIFKCIRTVMAGEFWFGHDRLHDMLQALRSVSAPAPATPVQRLTRRELEIIAAVFNGSTNREISKQYGLSEQTVKNHLSHIFDKVGVSTRLELALFAMHHKLLDSGTP